jgi:hypothetical protein
LRTLGTESEKFAAVGRDNGALGEFCQALYPLLVVNADDFGRLDGKAWTVKHAIWSTSRRRLQDFERALVALTEAALIRRAEVGGRRVIQIEDFERAQVGLHKRTASRFPEVPRSSHLREEKGREEKRREVRTGADAPAAPNKEAEKNGTFGEFWACYPKKVAKTKALKAWRALNPDADLVTTILAAVERHTKTPKWIKDGGEFIPFPATWLNQRRWEDEIESATKSADAGRWYDACQHEPQCEKLEHHQLRLAQEGGDD